jgi:hypothetical protein
MMKYVGFVYNFKNYKFVYINSYILYEKNLYGAHELFTIWYSDTKTGGIIKK